MGKIVLIEHSGEGCGIGYAEEGECVCEVKGDKIPGSNHSSGLGLMMSDCLAEAGVAIKDIEAIAISEGPGSYTSLRTESAA